MPQQDRAGGFLICRCAFLWVWMDQWPLNARACVCGVGKTLIACHHSGRSKRPTARNGFPAATAALLLLVRSDGRSGSVGLDRLINLIDN